MGILGFTVAQTSYAQSSDADNDGVLDGADLFPCRADIASMQAFPAENAFAVLAFEDQWPSRGDYDFNDLVLEHNTEIYRNAAGQATEVRLTYRPRAMGALFDNGVAVHLPIARASLGSAQITRQVEGQSAQAVTARTDESDVVVDISSNIRSELFAGATGQINTDEGRAAVAGKSVTIRIVFVSGVALNGADAPFDVFIYRSFDYSHQIHRTRFAGTDQMNVALRGSLDDRSTGIKSFVDTVGVPFVLELPTTAPHPQEGRRIDALFPRIVDFAQSGGAQSSNFFAVDVVSNQSFRNALAGSPTITAAVRDQSCVVTDFLNPTFELGTVGWSSISGTAFTNSPTTSCYNSGPCFGTKGAVSAVSGPSESAVGVFVSNSFIVTGQALCWQNSGFKPNYLALDYGSDGTEDVIVPARGNNGAPASGDNWGEQCVSWASHLGERVSIRLVDNTNNSSGSGFSWAGWDSFVVLDTANGLFNGDFERGAAGWTIRSGTAFNNFPMTNCSNAGACFDTSGINTRLAGEPAVGVLESDPFTIPSTATFICWQNGGFKGSFTAIDVDANGTDDITVPARGNDGNSASGDNWGTQCTDVTAFRNRTATIRLVDNDTNGSFGWVTWDNISIITTTTGITNGDFERGKAGWAIRSGTAFNNFPMTNCSNAGACFGTAGLNTRLAGEPAVGVLESFPFMIPSTANQLCWQNGGFKSSFTAIDVDINGTDDITLLARGNDGSGISGDNWGQQCVDVTSIRGRLASLRLVDNDTGSGFAWVTWDSFAFTP